MLACISPVELLLPPVLWVISASLGLASLTLSTSTPERALKLAIAALSCWILLALYSLPTLAGFRSGLVAWLIAVAPAVPPTLAITFALYGRKPQSPDPNRCQTCNYELRGLHEPRCPECGTYFEPNLLSPPPNP